jgi:hypothetical protein
MQTQGEFLSSELVWFGSYTWGGPPGSKNYYHRPDYILDLTNGQRYELIDLNQMPLLEGNKFDPKYYAYFQSAEQVFILQNDNRVIALAPNLRQNPQGNVIYYKNQLNSETNFEDGEVLKQLMKDLGVKYELVDLSYRYADVRSPTGKYILRDDGVYLLGMDRPAVTLSSRYSFRSWYYDESGVVIREPGYHLIDLGSAFGSSFEYYYIPGPVLKVPLPAP